VHATVDHQDRAAKGEGLEARQPVLGDLPRVANQAPPFAVHVATMRSESGDAARPADTCADGARSNIIFGWRRLPPNSVSKASGRVLVEVARRHEAVEDLVIVHVVGVRSCRAAQVQLA